MRGRPRRGARRRRPPQGRRGHHGRGGPAHLGRGAGRDGRAIAAARCSARCTPTRRCARGATPPCRRCTSSTPSSSWTGSCTTCSRRSTPPTLDPQAARLLEKTLTDFRRSGVDRDDETRARITEINEQLTTVGLQFRQNLRDDKRSIRVAPERLGGMPQDWLDAHPADDEGLVTITSDYPDAIPVRTFCTDRDVRAQMVDAFLNIGWPTNEALLQEMFELREELARLVGYDTWADYDADVKMIGKGSAIPEFIDRIADVALESGERDRARAARPAAAGPPGGDRDRRRRLPLLRGAGPQGAVRRRRPGRPHLLRLHGRPGRAARRDRPAVRPVVHAGDRRRAVAPRRDGVRRDARRRASSGGSSSTSTRARTSTTTPRSSRSPTAWPDGSSPRASWSATSPRG